MTGSKIVIEPLQYTWSGALLPQTGIQEADLRALAPKLEAARQEVLADVALWKSGAKVPAEKDPLDAGFIDLPQRLLTEYREKRSQSELGRILTTARRLADQADRIVVLGIGGSYMGARALLEGCCHPYHNDLPRGARGSWPRIHFDGNNVDNDSTQGLLDVLGRERAATGVDDRWAIVVISKSGGTMETAVAFRQYLAALRQSVQRDDAKLAQLIVPVTGNKGKLFDLAKALSLPETFDIPEGVGGRFSIFTAVGLLPAALMGLDLFELLEGAAAMTKRFETASPGGDNPVLDYVGVSHLLEAQRGANIRVLSVWNKGLEAAGPWYDQLLAESLGKPDANGNGVGSTPLTVVNTRDLHSRGQQHQAGRRDKLITNVILKEARRDRLAVGRSELDQDGLNAFATKTLPEIMNAAVAGTNQAYREDQRPTTDLTLARSDEAALGQFFQMMMLATVVEGRLIGINPYGQPGVEAYKKHMREHLLK